MIAIWALEWLGVNISVFDADMLPQASGRLKIKHVLLLNRKYAVIKGVAKNFVDGFCRFA